ncbi:glutamate racemase [Shewanella dokdonensis]|uniref:Glutamate racemase n=1 Tax=Shewanella dokdonensis TaxID=712036 RepID=A0ABX8DKE8_9GAMM|nr:glutamate racemase [Shewanella dokdonensis]MCL1076239.1 glutamate racemase [Shewanella dokdonensis]QVK24387.1 glutamate racemase [Shewanella dokdonensis]
MSHTILVFDSGVGGLSVLQEIRKLLPGQHYHYLFDNARLPYGELGEAELIRGCVALIEPMVKQLNADIVVIACNTASTLVLPTLRQSLGIPVVGVVPAIKPAAQLSKLHHIGLLATPGTIKREYTHELIRRFAEDCRVELFGSSELVMLAEQKIAGMPIAPQQLQKLLAPITQSTLDVLVLGCTHFPMLKAEIAQALGAGVTLLDSGEAIARRVKELLPADATTAATETAAAYYTAAATETAAAYYTAATISDGLKHSLQQLGFSHINHVS